MLIASSAAVGGTVYKWVDQNGVVHYSDYPTPGAEIVHIEGSVVAPPVPASTATPAATAGPSAQPAESFRYASCAITSPANEDTLQNAFSVSASWQFSPQLRIGDQVKLALDGQLVSGVPVSATSFTITTIARGAHTLQVSVLDPNGKGLCQSSPVTFYVFQNSVIPAQRPRPTPRG